ncbi:Flp pilus assembly protein CpaB [Roseitranquillus sediminis]|uniref:Flp pilus assembly protein CpaB n=1 Tax=Roseitranquillus sediminis TaxID=2809051 RepID=UPI001D0CD4C0|nr:Flp pilus assembly protein CpaB [Roseitranquillus sediminis]MBM9594754.1 Flp pilus assembly protein CpaB [Roseitranquillus sediminis]
MMRLAIVMIAIVAGGGAGWLALQATWRELPEPETVILEEPKVDVLTPTVDLTRGARIDRSHLIWTAWPADRVSSGMILEEEQPGAPDTLTGRVLRSNLYAGEPIRSQHLSENAGGFLSMVLQPGMRGLGVPISDDKTAGGFVLPNDRVDVLHTVVRDIDGDGTATGTTRTILTNVRVLAIGQTTFDEGALVESEVPEATAGASGGSTLIGSTATLEVTPEQAEILMAAAASGQLALALRAADDFGLSGIGDLAMLEGAAPALLPELVVRNDTGDVAEAGPRQREVTIISAGVPRTVLAAVKGGVDG